MAEKVKKSKNWVHYLVFQIILVVAMLFFVWTTINAQKLPIETENYFSEIKTIEDGLNYLVAYSCANDKVKEESEWICGENNFQVEEIEANRDQSFATGKGKNKSGKKFVWVAIKNESWWNKMGFEEADKPIECSATIGEIDPKMFSERFRYCVNENGVRIDRLDQD